MSRSDTSSSGVRDQAAALPVVFVTPLLPRRGGIVILEMTIIDVKPGAEVAFVEAYEAARKLVAVTPGCHAMRVVRGVETPTRFLLLVEWESVGSHASFTRSERFADWRALVGPLFASLPVVQHFAKIDAQDTS